MSSACAQSSQNQQKQQKIKKQKDVTQKKNYKIALEKEQTILQNYGNLTVGKDIRIENVKFKFNDQETFIHTLISGESNKQCLVLLHGYLAGSSFYYKMIKSLSQTYKVYCIDLLGMGLSDRQKFDFKQPKNYETATQFFIESFEEWRKTVGLEKFILTGHSFGGFISFNYYLQYPEKVEQLYLISPMSASKVQPERDIREEDAFKKHLSKLKFQKSLKHKFLRYMNKRKATLSSFLQSWYVPSTYLVNKIVDQRFKFETKQEKEDWKTYFKAVQFLPESTDHLIHEFVSMPKAQAKISMEELIEQNKLSKQQIPIHFIYGQRDWMDYSGAIRLLKSNQLQGTISFVKDSGHLIPFEQPDSLLQLMYEQLNNPIIIKKEEKINTIQNQIHTNQKEIIL